jgi:hypothetical protein
VAENNPFDFLDFDYTDVVEATKDLDSKRLDRDNRICVCGHPLGRHKPNPRGVIECKPTKMYCSCRTKTPVLKAEDVRDFLFRTVGGGQLHALSRGIQNAVDKGHTVEWLIEPKCEKCGAEGKVSPTPVTKEGFIKNEPTGFDALLCRECRLS